MKLNDAALNEGIERFKPLSQHSKLPQFEELPNIELYMDQVIALVNRYLSFFNDSEDDSVITHSMINNYVKLKVIPTPQKKRYNRIHLACLIMIGALKQTLSIAAIEILLPNDCDEQKAAEIYNKFVVSLENSLTMATEMAQQQLELLAEQKRYEDFFDLATDMAVGSTIFKVFTDKLLIIHNSNDEKKQDKSKEKAEKSKEKQDKTKDKQTKD